VEQPQGKMGANLVDCESFNNGSRNYNFGSSDTFAGNFFYDFECIMTRCKSRGAVNFEVECTRVGTNHNHDVVIDGCDFERTVTVNAVRINTTNPSNKISIKNSRFNGFTTALNSRTIPQGGVNSVINCEMSNGLNAVALTQNSNVSSRVIGNNFASSALGTIISTIGSSDKAIVSLNTFSNASGTPVNLAGANNINVNNVTLP
jgi:hypothetical protein